MILNFHGIVPCNLLGDWNPFWSWFCQWWLLRQLVMIWSIYIALNQALAPSSDHISLGLWGMLERLWKLKSSQHRFSTMILERKASCWDDIKGNLLIRFTMVYFTWEFPWLVVTGTLPFTLQSSLTLHNKRYPLLTLASGVKRSGWQAANEQ